MGVANSWSLVWIIASVGSLIYGGAKNYTGDYAGEYAGEYAVEYAVNSFYVVFCPILAPIPNFIQIAWKTQKLKFFAIGQFWLVGFGW